MEQNLFYGGELPSKNAKDKGFYWVTTRLLRESGPWYGGVIKSPGDVCRLINEHLELENADREYFVCIYLDRKGNLNCVNTVSIGGLSSTSVHPREVFKPALLTSSESVILVHNHPSGDSTPSKEDRDVTDRLKEAGEILGIKVLDHIIIGVGSNYSFKEQGYIQ